MLIAHALLLAVTAAGSGAAPSPGLFALPPESLALIELDAERSGLARRPEVAARIDEARQRLVVEQLVADNTAVPAPSDAEVRASAEAADVQVVVRGTREDAAAALERLKSGGSLATEAKASLDPVARDRGGALGWVTRGQMPAPVAADAFVGAVGAWRGPYDVGGRWFVVRVKERKAAPKAGAELEQARSQLVAQRRAEARTAYLARLRERAKVTVDEAFLTEAAGREPSAADRERVVATAGTRKVRYDAVLAAAGGMAAPHGAGHGAAAMQLRLARQLADVAVLDEEAGRANLARRPAVAEKLAAARRDILVTAYYDDLGARTPAPTAAEVQARFDARPSEFQVPASRRCAHAVASSEQGARKLKARVAGGETFEKVAREASEDKGTGANGGDIGDVTDERLARMDPKLAAAIRKLAPRKVSEPVKTAMGWHVLRCEPVPARRLALAEVQDRIAASIRYERISAAVNTRLAELKAHAESGARMKQK
jgi:peptidyl-prolyl cis-trans isomerase C